MASENNLQRAFVVRAKDLGGKVQLVCRDDFGVLSVYLDYQPFALLTRILCRAGLELPGALIEFNRELVRIALPGQRWQDLATSIA